MKLLLVAVILSLLVALSSAFAPRGLLSPRLSTSSILGKIHDAAENGDLAFVAEQVAAEKKMLYSKDIEGNTPLHKAALNGHVDLCRYLIDQGADPNFKNDRGRTPLQWVAQWAHYGPEFVEITCLLAARGGDIYLKNKDGKSALDFASDSKIQKGNPFGDRLKESWSGTKIEIHPDKSDYFRSTIPVENLVPVYQKKTAEEEAEAARAADLAAEQKALFEKKMVEKMAKGGRSFESGKRD